MDGIVCLPLEEAIASLLLREFSVLGLPKFVGLHGDQYVRFRIHLPM